MIEYGSKHEEFKFEFKIEQLPDGTFVGRSENPKLEIKGASPQEIQQKIQSMMGSGILKRLLGVDMSTAMTGKGIEVSMHKSGDVNDGLKLSLDAVFRHNQQLQQQPEQPQLGRAPEAFDAGSVRAQEAMKWIVGLLLLGGMAWWFFRP